MRKNGAKTQRFIGSRVLLMDEDPSSIMREFMDAPSSVAHSVYTTGNEMTNAFSAGVIKKQRTSKKTTKTNEDENKKREAAERAYGNDTNLVFKTSDYEREMSRLDIYPSQRGHGCNHGISCTKECRIFHDYHIPARNHYHHDEGTTSYERTRYGRFVKGTGNSPPVTYIRLCDDKEVEAINYPRDALYEEGWHHESWCPLDCVRYHYEGPPERYTRQEDGFFLKEAGGRWLYDWANNEKAYIRVGPNDTTEPGNLLSTAIRLEKELDHIGQITNERRKREAVVEKSKMSFRDMPRVQLVDYLSTFIKNQDAAIEAVVDLLLILQSPIEEADVEWDEDGSVIESEPKNRINMVACGDQSLATVMQTMSDAIRLLLQRKTGIDTQVCQCLSSLKDQSISDAILEIRTKEKAMPSTALDQSLILFLSVKMGDGFDAFMKSLENRVPSDIYLVLFVISTHSEEEAASQMSSFVRVPFRPVVTIEQHKKTIVDYVVSKCRDYTHSLSSCGTNVSFQVNETVLSQLADYVIPSKMTITESMALSLVTTELDRFIETINAHYTKILDDNTVFKEALITGTDQACRDEIIVRFGTTHAMEGTKMLFYFRYPMLTTMGGSAVEYIQLCLENKWQIPYLSFYHTGHLIHCVHMVTPVPPPDTTADLDTLLLESRKKRRLVDLEMNPIKKKRVNSVSCGDNDDMDDNSIDVIHHDWQIDERVSNRKSNVYSCSCPLESSIHYRRQCSSGEHCIGDGYKYSLPKGYCSRACRVQQEK